MRLIIGLGNPGERYALTRHNAGFMVVDAMAEKINEAWQTNKKFNADIVKLKEAKLTIGSLTSAPALLIKPLTFMNNSGQAVQAVMNYYSLLPKKLGLLKIKNCDLSEALTVIHDDLDIELGKYKVSVDSRSAGHKGVNSIINHLKTKNFKRIRIGIKTELAKKMPTEKFVLGKFTKEELGIINNLIPEIIRKSN